MLISNGKTGMKKEIDIKWIMLIVAILIIFAIYIVIRYPVVC